MRINFFKKWLIQNCQLKFSPFSPLQNISFFLLVCHQLYWLSIQMRWTNILQFLFSLNISYIMSVNKNHVYWSFSKVAVLETRCSAIVIFTKKCSSKTKKYHLHKTVKISLAKKYICHRYCPKWAAFFPLK